jgi:hypothetical protein
MADAASLGDAGPAKKACLRRRLGGRSEGRQRAVTDLHAPTAHESGSSVSNQEGSIVSPLKKSGMITLVPSAANRSAPNDRRQFSGLTHEALRPHTLQTLSAKLENVENEQDRRCGFCRTRHVRVQPLDVLARALG